MAIVFNPLYTGSSTFLQERDLLDRLTAFLKRHLPKSRRLSRASRHLATAVKDFKHVASLTPSSQATARTLVNHLPENARRIIEYGPGTGNITTHLLQALGPNGGLVAVEFNPRFVQILKKIEDHRFGVLEGSVLQVLPLLRAEYPEGVDAIVSGIPFSLIPEDEREAILEKTKALLRPGGRFIAYQNSKLLVPYLRKHFGNVKARLEPRNLPPYFILVSQKTSH